MVNYPTSLDNDTTLYDVTDHVDDYMADHHNVLKDAVIALETMVGITGSENFVLTTGDIMSGVLTMTGASVGLDINPSGAGAQTIVSVVPTAAIGGVQFIAYEFNAGSLDPSAGSSVIAGIYMDLSTVDQANSPALIGASIVLPATYINATTNAASFMGDGRTLKICTTDYALDISGTVRVDGALTLVSDAVSGVSNLTMTGELDMTGASAKIDMNPAGAGDIFNITPTITLPASTAWTAFRIDGGSLDPTGANTEISGINIVFSGILMTNNPNIWGLKVVLPATYGSATEYAAHFEGDGKIVEICNDTYALWVDAGNAKFDESVLITGELDMTGTGAKIDLNPSGTGQQTIIDITPTAAIIGGASWKGIGIDCGALDPTGSSSIWAFWADLTGVLTSNSPYLYGVIVTLPSDYGTSLGYAGHFQGDGRTLYLCSTAHAIETSDSVSLGAITSTTIAAGDTDYDKFLVSHDGLIKFRTGAQVLGDIGAGDTLWTSDNSAVARFYAEDYHSFNKGYAQLGVWDMVYASGYFRSTGAAQYNYYWIPVNLPHGATVTALRVYMMRTAVGDNLFSRLKRITRTTGGKTTMANCGNALTSWSEISDTTVAYATIDNDLYSYVMEFYHEEVNNGEGHIRGWQIDYTVVRPQP